MLPAEADKNAIAILRKELAKKQLFDAPPVHQIRTAIPVIKQMWFRRTSIGVAVALLLGVLWITFPKNEIQVQPTIALEQPKDYPISTTPAITSDAPVVTDVALTSSKPSVTTSKQSRKNVGNASSKKAVVEGENIAVATSNEVSAPTDVMISRRYAKLIKATPVIEITQQDKM
jgi:hypothetical protein